MLLTISEALGLIGNVREQVGDALQELGEEPVVVISVPPGTELDEHLAAGDGTVSVGRGLSVPLRVVEHGQEPERAVVLRLGTTPSEARIRRLLRWRR